MDILRQSLYRIKHGLDTKIKNLFINEQAFLLKAIAQGILKKWYPSESYFKDEYLDFYNVIYRVLEDTKVAENPINTPSKFQSLTGGTGAGWTTSGNTLLDNNASLGSLNDFDFSLMRNNIKVITVTTNALLPNISYSLGNINFPFTNIVSNEIYATNLATDSVVYTTVNGKLSVSNNFKFYDSTLRLAVGHDQTPDGTIDTRNVDTVNNTFSKFVIGNDNTGLGDSFFNSISQIGRVFGINQYGGVNYLSTHLGINYAISSANGTTQYAVLGAKYAPFIELDAETGAIALYGESGTGGDFRNVTANLGIYLYRDGRVEIGGTSNIATGAFVINSTTRAFVPPRITSSNMTAMVSPVAGSFIYNSTTNTPHYFNGSNWVNITTTSPAGNNREIQFNNSGVFGAATNFSYSTNGNLLLGTTNDIGGRLRVLGTGTGTTTWTAQFHNSTGTSNTMLLRDDGRVIWGSNTFTSATAPYEFHGVISQVLSGAANTMQFSRGPQTTSTGSVIMGYNAAPSTTVHNIVAIGNGAAQLNTSSGTQGFVAIGQNAGRGSSGVGFIAIGHDAARQSTTGAYVTIGYRTAYWATTLTDAIVIGYSAAQLLVGGGNAENFTRGIYIGRSALVSSNGAQNEIVIGYQGIGLGSNTTSIGNVSTTHTNLFGNLTLGTTTNASGRLQVWGSGSTSATWTAQFHNSTGTSNTLMLSDSGNVLIGTNVDAGFRLDVNGNVRFRNIQIESTDAFHFGDKDTDGSWRITRNGTDLEIQLRVGGTYITKGSFTP